MRIKKGKVEKQKAKRAGGSPVKGRELSKRSEAALQYVQDEDERKRRSQLEVVSAWNGSLSSKAELTCWTAIGHRETCGIARESQPTDQDLDARIEGT